MIFLKWRNGCTYCTSTIDSSAIIKRCRIVYFGNFLGGLGEFGMQRPIPYLTIILCLLMISSTWDIIAYQISRKYSACASLSLAAPATLAALSLGHSWMRAALASHSVSTISPKSFSSNSFRRSSYLVSLYIYIYIDTSSKNDYTALIFSEISVRHHDLSQRRFLGPNVSKNHKGHGIILPTQTILNKNPQKFTIHLQLLWSPPPKKKWVICDDSCTNLFLSKQPPLVNPTCQPPPWLPSPCWPLPYSLPLPC